MPEKEHVQSRQGFQSLKNGSRDPKAVEAYYDDWAESYNNTLKDWNYRAADEAATALAACVKPGDHVLDVGCGTGLLGKALSAKADYILTGADISGASLKIAESQRAYQKLTRHDLQVTPLPFGESAFDAAACVGVLTYIDDAGKLFRDLCRMVKPGGHVYFTHREDRWADDDYGAVIQGLVDEGLWKPLQISDPRPYLPGNEDFADNIHVIHVLCRVT